MPEFQAWALEILACPSCRASVRLSERGEGLICDVCKVIYPIEDGIPQMLVESQRPLSDFESSDRPTQ